MSKHTIEISERPARLSLQRKQLVVEVKEADVRRTFACEDVGVLILQHPGISLSSAVLTEVLNCGAVVVFCDNRHLPAGLLLPTVAHSEVVPRMTAQLEAAAPIGKQAWKAIVQAKLSNQAEGVPDPARKKILRIREKVKSGDPENCEAQGAKHYWRARFPEQYEAGDRRNPGGDSLFNMLLNYGYAILRAAVARAVVGFGLQPAIGVFHSRRDNPFCLADDLMEPLRPLVDRVVEEILIEADSGTPTVLDRAYRTKLLEVLTWKLYYSGDAGPLIAILPRYISSYYRFLTRETDRIIFPQFEE